MQNEVLILLKMVFIFQIALAVMNIML